MWGLLGVGEALGRGSAVGRSGLRTGDEPVRSGQLFEMSMERVVPAGERPIIRSRRDLAVYVFVVGTAIGLDCASAGKVHAESEPGRGGAEGASGEEAQ